VPGFSSSPDSPGYQASCRAARLIMGVPKAHDQEDADRHHRDHTACFIVALMHCTAETPVPHNLARP